MGNVSVKLTGYGRVVTIAVLVAAFALSACQKRNERVLFDGKYYPVKESGAKGDRNSFVVTVRRAEQGLDAAREAGRHGGTRYCLKNFGTSDIDWTQGPDAEDAELELSGGNLIFRGRCVLW